MYHGTGWTDYVKHETGERPRGDGRALLARVWGFARPYRGRIAALLLTILVVIALERVTPLLLTVIVDQAIPRGDRSLLGALALGLVGSAVLAGAVGVWQRYLNSRIGEGIIYDLRAALYEQIQRMPFAFFVKTRTGELLARLTNDVLGAEVGVSTTIPNALSNLVSLVITLAIMLVLDWRLTLLAVLVLPLFLLPARRIAGVLRRLRRQSMEHMAEANATMSDTLNVSGALLTKLFGREAAVRDRFCEQTRQVRDTRVREAVVSRWLFMFMTTVGGVGAAGIYWLGGALAIDGELSIGVVVAFSLLLPHLYAPLVALTNSPVAFVQSMLSFERVFEVLDLPRELVDRPGATPLERVEGKLTFCDVTLSYGEDRGRSLAEIVRFVRGGTEAHLKRGRAAGPADADARPRPRHAVQGVSFEVRPGEVCALVGPSGAGKTSIAYLAARLYDPTDGCIRIDDRDLRDISLASLPGVVGLVTQETYLFPSTIRDNLRFARPDATDEEMIEACKTANIHDAIAALPEGYDTLVGERGYRLSGGERQRLSIARIVLRNPRILVLDEATSSLDSLSETLVQQALQRVMKDRTSLVVAHRLSTVMSADTILVVDRGRIVERGTHQELLARGGLYARLSASQLTVATEEPTELLLPSIDERRIASR